MRGTTSRGALAPDDRLLIDRFEAEGQGHVFRFLPELDGHEARSLVSQARRIDLESVRRLASEPKAAARGAIAPPGDELARIPEIRASRSAALARGLEELAAGRVAVVIAAGGQGTRLGSAAPKGLWPVGPASGKTLFQWQMEKVLHWSRRLKRGIPVAVMVSDATQRATEDAFRWYGHFGLDPTWIRTPCQASLPALDDGGKLLLEARSRIAMAPNGHGGLFAALAQTKLLDYYADLGVTTLAYAQVDNPLLRVVDPAFLGMHLLRGSEISSKSVAKRNAAEKVGVFARVAGRPCVVEYSELSDAETRAVASDGSLLFSQGSIAAHCIDLGFARRMAAEGLPLHRARKKVPFVDADGRTVRPERENATKFESFLFDAIPRAERSLVFETRREDEFAPMKSIDGEDSPETARAALIALFRGWHERAGVAIPHGALEVDPSKAPDEDAFRRLHGAARP